MGNVFEKKFGFTKPPKAFFEGTFQCFKSFVQAVLECKMCGGTIHIKFRGNPDTMSPEGLKEWILLRAESRHQCPAVADILSAKRHKHFADIIRGSDKLKEEQYKRGRA